MDRDAVMQGVLIALVAVFLALVVLSVEAWRIERVIEPIATSTIVRAATSF